ncbi:maltase A3-like isoform X1 [Teleopsis dalmanni]|uniref:maltase A3-like isoform X1 n=1 Tax=Teleopsis dalmanni TaxID=139649 RepID=UPI0018CE8D99|nr:maltase A3-like isoform X1 [Teleopsis dalmanni]
MPLRLESFYRCLALTFILFSVSNANYNNKYENIEYIKLKKTSTEKKLGSKAWWQTASFYQIYPRSFKDTNNDGVGDLRGIAEKLPYLKEIGIAATWLSPIFTSPMADFGYDISNITEIDPLFGTMQDFEDLIAKSKEVGVKIILDFVPNHTSDECEWFKKSAALDPEYKDFYVWHPGKIIDGTRHPPTNWVSVFRGSAWQWHEGRQEYYLHEFLSKQPDLNYRNPKVRETMNEVLRFWLRKGVAGFRVDAVPFVFEVAPDANGNWPDEPRNDWVTDPDDYGYLKHIYTVDQPETIDIVYEWRSVLDDFQRKNGGDERVILAEAYSPIEVDMKYYGNATAEGAQIPFNFLMINWLTNDSDAYHYAETVNTWLKNMPEGRTANWVIGNHDQNRVGSRLGADRIDMMNMLILTLPGCSITYNGEEIGMTDVWISWKDTVDPSACHTNPDTYEKFSRDPERTPFQWSDEKNAGFSTANKTWLPISDMYKEVNVKRERGMSLSHLNVYKRLQELRQEPTLRHGDVLVKAVNNAVLGVKRTLLNDHTYVTVMNIFDNVVNVDLSNAFDGLPKQMEYAIITSKSSARIGNLINISSLRLLSKEAVVLRSPTKLTTTVGYYTYYSPEDQV